MIITDLSRSVSNDQISFEYQSNVVYIIISPSVGFRSCTLNIWSVISDRLNHDFVLNFGCLNTLAPWLKNLELFLFLLFLLVCSGSVVVTTYDFESSCPGSNPEWG